MKKLEMEYGPFICTIIFYLRYELLTFARDFFRYRSLQVQL